MTGLLLSALWGRLRGLLAAAKKFIAYCPLCASIAALALLAGVQTWRLSGVKDDLTVARAQLAAGRVNVAALKAAKAATEARQGANTQRINDATAPTRTAALAGAAAYARAHRVRRPAPLAPACDASRSLPDFSPAAGGAEAPTEGSDMVAIPRAAFDACTLNSADLGLAFDWATGSRE